MDDKARFDACMKLAQYGTSIFDGRRQYEWKVRFGFLVFIVAAIVYMPRNAALMNVIPLGAILYEFLYSRGMWVANENDKAFSRHYITESTMIFKEPDHIPDEPPPKVGGVRKWVGFRGDWSHLFQFIATVFLVSMIYVLPQIGKLPNSN